MENCVACADFELISTRAFGSWLGGINKDEEIFQQCSKPLLVDKYIYISRYVYGVILPNILGDDSGFSSTFGTWLWKLLELELSGWEIVHPQSYGTLLSSWVLSENLRKIPGFGSHYPYSDSHVGVFPVLFAKPSDKKTISRLIHEKDGHITHYYPLVN